MKKKLNGYLAAMVIILSGVAVAGYAAYEIEWENFKFSFKSVFLPLLFIFVVSLLAFKAAGIKDVDITRVKADKKIGDAIYHFNQKTRGVQRIIFWGAVLILFLFYLGGKICVHTS
ncbi:hypothetical protein [Catenovulum sediminis]|uniref:Uncharacterized protein n=1 Tax=Catenovulum sediminis TaxID=1740262 RepID=A0ABV1RIP4_9ALTE|nr:hypothetical protein [Catenovulum sediminis]